MTSDHFQQALDTLADRQPFIPFTVEFVDGGQFEVDHAKELVARDGVATHAQAG